jgi:hypothetical protein
MAFEPISYTYKPTVPRKRTTPDKSPTSPSSTLDNQNFRRYGGVLGITMLLEPATAQIGNDESSILGTLCYQI